MNRMSTIGICHRYFWNQSITIRDDWSWICYYYPSGTENPLDHNMIYKTVEEFEKTNPEATRILLRKFEVNFNNSSLSLNDTNTNLSKTSTSMFLLLLILSICICGSYYCCKKKTNNISRSSEDSEYSQETIEEEDSVE